MEKEMIAMLLAGGQGSRLYALTEKLAKPAVPFGGKYRIIDFPLSNCVNSGIDTVGVLTQYQPLDLNDYICNGAPWEIRLDCHADALARDPLTIYITPTKAHVTVDVSSAMAGRMEKALGLTAELLAACIIPVDDVILEQA